MKPEARVLRPSTGSSVVACAEASGLHMRDVQPSSLEGKHGNLEYAAWFSYEKSMDKFCTV